MKRLLYICKVATKINSLLTTVLLLLQISGTLGLMHLPWLVALNA